MKLHGYWRSSATYRVRIALNLKGLDYQYIPVHLIRNGGEHHSDAYRALNPQQLLPALEHDGHTLSQSLAIIEYLDEAFPDTVSMVPGDAAQRAAIRAFALAIACEITPLGNLRVQNYLKAHHVDPIAWSRHWVETTFAPLERIAAANGGDFCMGDVVTLADVLLVPQMYNARRFEVDLTPYPTLVAIDARCRALEAFIRAAPENQPDAA